MRPPARLEDVPWWNELQAVPSSVTGMSMQHRRCRIDFTLYTFCFLYFFDFPLTGTYTVSASDRTSGEVLGKCTILFAVAPPEAAAMSILSHLRMVKWKDESMNHCLGVNSSDFIHSAGTGQVAQLCNAAFRGQDVNSKSDQLSQAWQDSFRHRLTRFFVDGFARQKFLQKDTHQSGLTITTQIEHVRWMQDPGKFDKAKERWATSCRTGVCFLLSDPLTKEMTVIG